MTFLYVLLGCIIGSLFVISCRLSDITDELKKIRKGDKE